MKYFLYGNSGGIGKIKEELANPKETFDTIKDACIAVVEKHHNAFDIEDLYIRYSCYDDRIDKDVYIISTGCYGYEDYMKEYGCPQFVSYMVTI